MFADARPAGDAAGYDDGLCHPCVGSTHGSALTGGGGRGGRNAKTALLGWVHYQITKREDGGKRVGDVIDHTLVEANVLQPANSLAPLGSIKRGSRPAKLRSSLSCESEDALVCALLLATGQLGCQIGKALVRIARVLGVA
eukprot:scaffold12578_cov30-Tisochrysis_lutea.AAC.10